MSAIVKSKYFVIAEPKIPSKLSYSFGSLEIFIPTTRPSLLAILPRAIYIGLFVSMHFSSVQSPAAQMCSIFVLMLLSTTIPPVLPIFIPAFFASSTLGTTPEAITQKSASTSSPLFVINLENLPFLSATNSTTSSIKCISTHWPLCSIMRFLIISLNSQSKTLISLELYSTIVVCTPFCTNASRSSMPM